ncbi:hypothetical protein RN001_006753 [Aquatica leii]|uniref:Protein kinase domain-containing protein n=1 Tax=Aquatica leii TaxID=1421715 RepID=A0AAN7PE21_9COLE|nr:hypothetical protein RN001_006753 [Aquatica leii]
MGNEHSNLSGLEYDEKAIEVTDFWIHHSATMGSGNYISVFIGEPLIDGSLWWSQTPLERATKCLMLYRHPSILKYISSWHKGSKFYLAVEDVRPLSHTLSSQNTMQICIGLHSILKALCFLHDHAKVAHNNICVASIYVTKEGNWRLGGMEYLCKFNELTDEYLSKTRTHRYDKAVDPDETKSSKEIKENPTCIDSFAFGVLVTEVLSNRTDDDVPWLQDFGECASQLQNEPIITRRKLTSLLEHQFFIHDFIMIHSFLTELPLKTVEEKISFFSSLHNKLRSFKENVVANQLGNLLLSRMVLLDKTAQLNLLPFVLCPRQSPTDLGLFAVDSFKQYLVPKILQIFCVRDAQIRLLLLEYLHKYLWCFSQDELQMQILPELLVGIKDTNDQLVAMTLKALADIVPILGAAAVIGGKRAKLFNDGRPITHTNNKYERRRTNSRKSQTEFNISRDTTNINSPSNSVSELNQRLVLLERPSPDGEEDETSNEDVELSIEGDLDNWEDWDINTENNESSVITSHTEDRFTEETQNTRVSPSEGLEQTPLDQETTQTYTKKTTLPDVLELDIKNQRHPSRDQEDFDFFQDMEPVIETSKPFLIAPVDDHTFVPENKLDMGIIEADKHDEEGWGDDWD